jgi:hypothetical protein
MDKKSQAQLRTHAEEHGIVVEVKDMGLMNCNGTHTEAVAAAWLESEFEIRADTVPNQQNVVNLDPVRKEDIWTEYVEEVGSGHSPDATLAYSSFCEMWQRRFFYVKVMKLKTVCGKCPICAALLCDKSKTKDLQLRILYKEIHLFHKATFMGERLAYYQRRGYAKRHPQAALSMISDGMDQNNCSVPYQGMLLHISKMTS